VTELDCLLYGAGDANEGVCLLLRIGPYHILLDCGLNDLSPLQDVLPHLDFVWCSHAHPDHARGLLALHQSCSALPIYTSDVTADLLPLNWSELAGSDRQNFKFGQILPWRSPVEVQDGLQATLIPAGHLPGAAVLHLAYTPRESSLEDPRASSLIYTGDFLLSNSRLVDGLPLEELRQFHPDVLILEGSYGTARLPRRRQQENDLTERISRATSLGQSVLLPVPALGLAQELLLLLRSHHLFTGRDLDIWVDPAIAAACDAYLKILLNLPASVQNFARHQSLFWDDRIRPRVHRLHSPDVVPLTAGSPQIILVDIATNWLAYCQPELQPWRIFLPERPGYALSASSPTPQSPNLMQIGIETYLLAEHCDEPSTTQLIHNLRPQHVIFVHGSPAYLTDLASLDELCNRYHLHTPIVGRVVELPVGETFHQPANPETRYEGELIEEGTSVTISVGSTITTDPRWQRFADTGLVEVRWQGDELVVRGLSQRDILGFKTRPSVLPRATCGNCCHYQGQYCLNPSSALYTFKVTSDGYCPAYEALVQPDQSGLESG
jgi:Cft2 family RNA processing exonuclease